MQSVDVTQSSNTIKSRLNSVKVYNEVSKSESELKKNAGDSQGGNANRISEQLEKVKEQKKRFEKSVPNSMDELLNFIGITQGGGNNTMRYLRKKMLEAAVKIEPEIKNIINKNALKAIGCSQEQTYETVSLNTIQLKTLPQIPNDSAIYIPIQSLDLFGKLKTSPNSVIGKVLYEKPIPSNSTEYTPYGGEEPFPMDKALYDVTQNPNSSFNSIFSDYYQGGSQQKLFDIGYTNVNQFGVTGDYFKVVLIERESNGSSTGNIVGNFLVDYYDTIKIVDTASIGAQIINLLTGSLTLSQEDSVSLLGFGKIIQRILGLCFDSRREIDVSGVAKIAELDGIDDSFFILNEVDLRNIEVELDNILNGVIEFVDCDNLKLPVNSDNLISQLTNLRDNESELTLSQLVQVLEEISDSVYNNPAWANQTPSNFDPQLSINRNIIKLLPLAVVASVLTPKVLLPIFILLGATQNKASLVYNEAVTDINEDTNEVQGNIDDTQNVLNETSNVVEDSIDFLKKFKSFSVEVVAEINQIFLRALFDILKRDILELISIILKDINNAKLNKLYQIVLSLLDIAKIISGFIVDFKKCKSLLDNILQLLKLINGSRPSSPITVPPPLLLFAPFLPGTSTQRSLINSIETMQSIGLPTGPLPDGSPNLMVQYANTIMTGMDSEQAQNGKVEGFGIVAPDRPGFVQLFAKSF